MFLSSKHRTAPTQFTTKAISICVKQFLYEKERLLWRVLNYSKGERNKIWLGDAYTFRQVTSKNTSENKMRANRSKAAWVGNEPEMELQNGKEQKAQIGAAACVLFADRPRGRGRANFCYSSQRTCSVETQTQSREKNKRSGGKKVCDGSNSFALPSRMACAFYSTALFTH